MSRRSVGLTTAVAISAMSIVALAQTADERSIARDLAAKRGDAVVVVLATLKTRLSVNGQEQARDQPMSSNATVLDGTGLTVLALSVLEPGDSVTRAMAANSPGQRFEMTTETTDLRLRLADGREVPAKVVLRDADLDLIFIKPTEAVDKPLTAIDAPIGKPSLLDLVVVLQRSSEVSGYRTYASFAYVQMTVEKPRPFYLIPSANMNGGSGLGSPVFDAAGRFVGVITRIAGARANPQPGVLPAEDIREIAKQAK